MPVRVRLAALRTHSTSSVIPPEPSNTPIGLRSSIAMVSSLSVPMRPPTITTASLERMSSKLRPVYSKPVNKIESKASMGRRYFLTWASRDEAGEKPMLIPPAIFAALAAAYGKPRVAPVRVMWPREAISLPTAAASLAPVITESPRAAPETQIWYCRLSLLMMHQRFWLN